VKPPSPALVLALIAALLLWVPVLQRPAGFVSQTRDAVNQALSLGRDPLEAFSRRFDQMVDFSHTAVNGWRRAHAALFGTINSRSVVVGEQDWLFYRAERADDGITIADLRGDAPFPPGELELIANELERRAQQLAAWNGHLLLAVVPNKERIYSSLLPLRFRPTGRPSRLDQLHLRLDGRGPLLLDLRPALEDAARRCAQRPLYFKLDTHWNGWGQHQGYAAIIDRLAALHPGLAPHRIEDQRWSEVAHTGGDLFTLLSIDAWIPPGRFRDTDWLSPQDRVPAWRFAQPPPAVYPAHRPMRGGMRLAWDEADTLRLSAPAPQAPWRVAVMHDSLGVIYDLGGHFAETTLRWTHAWDDQAILRERPQVVIHILGERYLEVLDPRFSQSVLHASAGSGAPPAPATMATP
jgi:hypothetical protein